MWGSTSLSYSLERLFSIFAYTTAVNHTGSPLLPPCPLPMKSLRGFQDFSSTTSETQAPRWKTFNSFSRASSAQERDFITLARWDKHHQNMGIGQLMFWVVFSRKELALFPSCPTQRACGIKFCMATVFTVSRKSCVLMLLLLLRKRDSPIFGAHISFYSPVEQISAVESTDFSLSNKHERKIKKLTYFVILLNSFFWSLY